MIRAYDYVINESGEIYLKSKVSHTLHIVWGISEVGFHHGIGAYISDSLDFKGLIVQIPNSLDILKYKEKYNR